MTGKPSAFIAIALILDIAAAGPATAARLPAFAPPGLVHQADGRHWSGDRRVDCSRPRDRRERRWCEERRERHDRRKKDELGAAIGLGILGLAVGAIVAGSIKEKEAKQRERDEWIDRCIRRYPSFDPRTGTFIGRDGREYYCR